MMFSIIGWAPQESLQPNGMKEETDAGFKGGKLLSRCERTCVVNALTGILTADRTARLPDMGFTQVGVAPYISWDSSGWMDVEEHPSCDGAP